MAVDSANEFSHCLLFVGADWSKQEKVKSSKPELNFL